MNKFWLWPLLMAAVLLSACQSTEPANSRVRDNKKAFNAQQQLKRAQEAKRHEARYFELVNQYQQGERVDYGQVWHSYVSSHLMTRLNDDIDGFDQVNTQVEQGQSACDSVDWLSYQQKLFFYLQTHIKARDCYESLGQQQQADYYNRSLQFVLQGLFSIGDGKTQQTAHQVLVAADADNFIALTGFKVIDYYMSIGDGGLGIYYVYVVERPDGVQSHIFFTFDRYLHHFLDVEYPFGWLGGRMAFEVIFPLAQRSWLYQIAAAQVHQSYQEYEQAAHYYLNAIADGSIVANYLLGMLCYQEQLDIATKDECFDYILTAAEYGYAPAYVVLAHFYRIGFGVTADQQQFELLMAKAQKHFKNGFAWIWLIESFKDSLDEQVIDDYYAKAIANGSIYGQISAYQKEAVGYLDKGKDDTILRQLFDSIKANLESQSSVAVGRFSGLNLMFHKRLKLTDEQVQWLLELIHQSAEKGYSASNYALGNEYMLGNTVPASRDKAMAHYRRAAQSFHERSAFELGRLYTTEGKTQDLDRAYNWFMMCSNYKPCLLASAMMVYRGYGNGWQDKQAFEIIKNAVDEGNIKMEGTLASAYEQGFGTDINITKAIELYARLANRNDKLGQYHLCRLGVEGHVIKGINDRPLLLCSDAVVQGYEPARQLIEKQNYTIKVRIIKPDDKDDN